MSHIKPTQPDNPVETTTPIQDHPERNEPMKTENTETTVTEAEETVEAEEVTETASAETQAAAVQADDADTDNLADVEADQGEEVDAYDPNDRLFGDNRPTPSRREPITRSFLGSNLAVALLIIVSAFCIGTGIKFGVDTIYADEFGGNHCYNGKKYNGDMPHSFEGTYEDYIKYSNMPDSGLCFDQIAHD